MASDAIEEAVYSMRAWAAELIRVAHLLAQDKDVSPHQLESLAADIEQEADDLETSR